MVRSASSLLFFLNPNCVKAPVPLIDIANVFGQFIEKNDQSSEKVNWSPDLAPSQVITVELLQFHLPILAKPQSASVAFIISAWDTVMDQEPDITPDEWLLENMPLLHQYLCTNEDTVKFAVFGVSAQGGDYGRQAIKENLVEMDEPAQRVIVQEQNTKHHNLMAPIEWIIQAWE